MWPPSCVYPALVGVAKKALAGSGIHVASVATSFPAGQAPLDIKLLEVRRAVEAGADEVDMVISRGRFLAGDIAYTAEEIASVKEACGEVHLKVILETGELGTLDAVRRASDLAMRSGADFIKTSTGKVKPAATMPVVLVMLEAIRDHYRRTGEKIGMKPAGGIFHREGRDPAPGHGARDAGAGLARSRPVSFRREFPGERRVAPDRQAAKRHLPVVRRLLALSARLPEP